jgi:FemAB-related protein (PEP-CTERM system-associated)
MEICELTKNDEKAWDKYVFDSENSTFYHQIGWKNVVEKTFGYKPCYLIALRENGIAGILPLFLIESKIFGRKLVSLPFSPYGGICSDNEAIQKALIEEARKIVNEKDLDYLEIKGFINYNRGFAINDAYVTYIIDLEKNTQKVWERIKRDRRRNVDNAKKYGLVVNWDASLNEFYNIHQCTMHDLGTPTHSIRFFKNCLNEFPNNIKVLTVKYNDLLVGCQLLFFYRDTIIAVWGSSFDKYKYSNPDQLTIWEVLKYGCEKGYKYFDFGRSLRATTAYNYKDRWGGYPKQLYYQYYLKNTTKIPDISQINPNREMFANVWKLLPLQVTNRFGPILRKNFP